MDIEIPIIGKLYKEILRKHETNLSEIEGFSDYWQWTFIHRINRDKFFNKQNLNDNYLKDLINEISNSIEKKYKCTLKLFIPFSKPPNNAIEIGKHLSIRKPNEEELQKINIIAKHNKAKKEETRGLFVQGSFIPSPAETSIYEIVIGEFSFNEIMELVNSEINFRMNQNLFQFIYKPDNQLFSKILQVQNAIKSHHISIFNSEFLTYFEIVEWNCPWVNQPLTKERSYNFMIYEETRNFHNKEIVKLLKNNLGLLFSELLDYQISQIEVLISRYSSILDPNRMMLDKIVDAMVMFEALFVPGIRGTKSHRLAFRIAMILENTETDRKKVYKFIQKLYRMRNFIVHGVSMESQINDNELISFYKYCNVAFFEAIEIYNPKNYHSSKPKWSQILGRLDFYGFDSIKSLNEMLGMK